MIGDIAMLCGDVNSMVSNSLVLDRILMILLMSSISTSMSVQYDR